MTAKPAFHISGEAMQTDSLLTRRCGASESGRTWKACVTATRPARRNVRSMWPGEERKKEKNSKNKKAKKTCRASCSHEFHVVLYAFDSIVKVWLVLVSALEVHANFPTQ